jgi:2-amino-4-hydroxy-6-hydroxymethyldihydropteridine diphosphokinase
VIEVAYLGLGSNVGDRRANLQAAVEELWAHDVAVLASSSIYETEPVGEVLDQPPFFNVCLEVETALEPEALLDACKAVERAQGRVLAGEAGYLRHGPRVIDVDILLLGSEPYSSARLQVPHPAWRERRFVLVPLDELGVPWAAEALRALGPGDGVRRAGPPLDVGP